MIICKYKTLIFSGLFPVSYIEGKGLTLFKKISEYNMAMERLIGVKKTDVMGKDLKILFIGDNPDYYNMIAHSTLKGINLESVEIPVKSEGGIAVTITEKNSNLAVVVRDDGIGIMESTDLGKSNGFGLNLVLLLADQINGRIERLSGKGTSFKIKIGL